MNIALPKRQSTQSDLFWWIHQNEALLLFVVVSLQLGSAETDAETT